VPRIRIVAHALPSSASRLQKHILGHAAGNAVSSPRSTPSATGISAAQDGRVNLSLNGIPARGRRGSAAAAWVPRVGPAGGPAEVNGVRSTGLYLDRMLTTAREILATTPS
jgi:hypothetical protein